MRRRRRTQLIAIKTTMWNLWQWKSEGITQVFHPLKDMNVCHQSSRYWDTIPFILTQLLSPSAVVWAVCVYFQQDAAPLPNSSTLWSLHQVIHGNSDLWISPTSARPPIQPLLFTFLTRSQQLLQESINSDCEYIVIVWIGYTSLPFSLDQCICS